MNRITRQQHEKCYYCLTCSVQKCNSHRKIHSNILFFRFPREDRDPERRRLWVEAVKRLNKDGTRWIPSEYSVICSKHFVGGKPLNNPYRPDYCPSIFPKGYSYQRSLYRYNRKNGKLPMDSDSEDPVDGELVEELQVKDFTGSAKDFNASDFYDLFTSFVKGKIPREILNNCELLYKCKTCQEVTSNVQNYLEHFIQCVNENLENESANIMDLCETELKDDDPEGKVENIGSECCEEFNHENEELGVEDADKNTFTCKLCDFKSISLLDCKTHARIAHNGFTSTWKSFTKIFHSDDESEAAFTDYVTKLGEPHSAEDVPGYCVVLDDRHEDKVNYEELLCRLCGKTFQYSNGLRQHLAVAHLGYKKYKCKNCEFMATTKNKCKKHSLVVHNVNCVTLKTNFLKLKVKTPKVGSQKSKCRSKKKKKKLIKCVLGTNETEVGNWYYEIRDSEHLDKVDFGRNLCRLCQKAFSDEFRLRQHLAVVHFGYERYKCKFCDFLSNAMSECTEHASTDHRIELPSSSEYEKCFHDLEYADVPGTIDSISIPTAGTVSTNSGPNPDSFSSSLTLPNGSLDEIVADDSNYTLVLKGNHEDTVDLKNKFCFKCNRYYVTSRMVRLHLATRHLGFARFKCRNCEFMTSLPLEARPHMKDVHNIGKLTSAEFKGHFRELRVCTEFEMTSGDINGENVEMES